MKALTVLGTLAMFLVGGGILAHGLPGLPHGLPPAAGMLLDAFIGAAAGAAALAVVAGVQRFRR
jgi:predicted DNA repair protein MutK